MTALIYIYLAGAAESIGNWFSLVAILCFSAAMCHWLWTALNGTEVNKKFCVYMAIFTAGLSLVAAIIPTKDTMYMMAYGYLGEKAGTVIVQTPEVQEITADLLKLVKVKVKEQIKAVEEGKK